jgi:UrcA family protein
MIMSTPKHAASLAILCAGLGAAVALADEPATVTLPVPHSLDKAHAAQLYQRIRTAAEQVCEPVDGKDIPAQRHYRSCVADAIANAVAQVNASELTAIHLADAGGEPRL